MGFTNANTNATRRDGFYHDDFNAPDGNTLDDDANALDGDDANALDDDANVLDDDELVHGSELKK